MKRFAVAAAVAVALVAYAAPAQAFTIVVSKLAAALQRSPVQTLGSSPNPLSAANARRLSARIDRRDPGRIYIAVVPTLSQRVAGQLAQDLSNLIVKNGVVVVVAGFNYHVTTTWGSGSAAESRLSQAVQPPGDSLRVQLQRTIDAFAQADAKAGHPGAANSAAPTKPKGGGVKAPSTGAPAATPTTSTSPSVLQTTPTATPQSHGGSSNAGLIVLLVAGGILVLAFLVWGGMYLRTSMRSSHRRGEENADIHQQAEADLIKLGEQIEALDIDSSMPNASAEGKDQYAKAIECYQEAERRLKTPKDEYQFERGQDEIRKGLQHVGAAGALFNPTAVAPASAPTPAPTAPTPSPTPPAPVVAPTAPPPPPTTGGHDMVSELAKLSDLHDRGVLTDAEFAEQKRRLIGD
jgi:hypothetical protein